MVTLSSPQWVKSNWASRPARMHLGEVHLLIRPMQRPPILQSSLQRPQLGRAEPPGMLLG